MLQRHINLRILITMLDNKVPREVLQKPALRRAWIKYQLELRGYSLRSYAKALGVSHPVISKAFLSPNSHIEEQLAETLGMQVHVLFPERFDAAGNRLHRTFAAHRRQPTRAPKPRNRKARGGT